jgi:hypothetical protein
VVVVKSLENKKELVMLVMVQEDHQSEEVEVLLLVQEMKKTIL